MRQAATVLLIISFNGLFGQKTVEDFGYREFSIQYLGDTVKFILPNKKNKQFDKKQILFLVQGSRAQPLVGYMSDKRYRSPITFLNFDLWLDSFHVITVSKPGIPLIIHDDKLNKKGEFIDSLTNHAPKKYIENNNLEYYTKRNYEVLKYLMKQDWVDTTKIVVAGHSEGSSIALDMADNIEEITHLIYSGGNPYYSTILDVIRKERKSALKNGDDNTESIFEYWKMVVNSPFSLSTEKGDDTYRYMYSFSQNENEKLKRIKKPTLITYGTLDTPCPYIDMFQTEVILEKIKHITFKPYIGLEHNYFKVKENGEVDYEGEFGWDKVGQDWFEWINRN